MSDRPVKMAHRNKTGHGWPLVLPGILAFVIGVWLFTPVKPAPVAPAVGPLEEPNAAVPMPAPAAPPPADAAPPDIPDSLPLIDSAAPAYNPRLNRANFNQIRNGMTEVQIIDLLGDPSETKVKSFGTRNDVHQAKILVWTHAVDNATIEVEFQEGQATGKNATALAAAPHIAAKPATGPIAESRLGRNNYDQILGGMTEEEVIAILGPPWASRFTTLNIQGPQKILYFRQDQPNITVVVILTFGKVTGKNWKWIGPNKR